MFFMVQSPYELVLAVSTPPVEENSGGIVQNRR
jgi:hypothetical protein